MLEPGQTMLLHSDGVAEAHGPTAEMFGFPRLLDVVGAPQRPRRRDRPRAHRARPLHPRRLGAGGRHHARRAHARTGAAARSRDAGRSTSPSRLRASPGTSGSERAGRRGGRAARARAGAARAAEDGGVRGGDERDRARQRVAPELPVEICVRPPSGELARPRSPTRAASARSPRPRTPDLEAKLEGLQKPRGWGLFLIQNMVDDVRVSSDGHHAHGRARHAARRRRR